MGTNRRGSSPPSPEFDLPPEKYILKEFYHELLEYIKKYNSE
jgi:hypothetical protein